MQNPGRISYLRIARSLSQRSGPPRRIARILDTIIPFHLNARGSLAPLGWLVQARHHAGFAGLAVFRFGDHASAYVRRSPWFLRSCLKT